VLEQRPDRQFILKYLHSEHGGLCRTGPPSLMGPLRLM
jgi:hypothetical protein